MCRFKIRFQGSAVAVMEQAKETIEGDGGSFSVSDSRVLFSVRTPVGRVDGTCVWADPSTIGVTITKKPFFVPCSTIKERMVAAFLAASKATTAAPQTGE